MTKSPEDMPAEETIAMLRQDMADLEMALTVAVEHGDIIESQLVEANDQLQQEIASREVAQRRLQNLVAAIREQKNDLEIIVGTLIDHGDSMDDQLWEQLVESEQRGVTDALTGLANRRLFDDHFIEHFKTCARHQRPFSLLMCDIDYFKQYNDTYGHSEGDECLKKIAATLKTFAHRTSDLAARYGGEEFSIILPETDIKGAQVVAEKVVKDIEALGLPHEGSQVASVITISVGYMSVVPQPNDDPRSLIIQTDHNLYRAKQLGRNRACTQSADVEQGAPRD